jgi:hypothetical protein
MTGVERVDNKSSANATNSKTESGVAGFSSMAAVAAKAQVQDYQKRIVDGLAQNKQETKASTG